MQSLVVYCLNISVAAFYIYCNLTMFSVNVMNIIFLVSAS